MHHRSRVKLVVLGLGLTGAALAACSIDIDGTEEAPLTEAGSSPDAATFPPDAMTALPDAQPGDAARDGGPGDAADGSDGSGDSGRDGSSDGGDGGPVATDGGYYGECNDGGPCNWALQFDGDYSGFVDAGRPVQDDFTLEAWVLPTSLSATSNLDSGDTIFFADVNGGHNDFSGGLIDNGVLAFATGFMSGGSDAVAKTPATVAQNAWVHLSVVRTKTSGVVVLYLGSSFYTIGSNSEDSLTASSIFDVGGGGGSSRKGFTGLIDEVRVYSYARLQSDVQNDATESFLTSSQVSGDANLVLYWRFDEGSGTTAFDSSKNGSFDGTLMGNSGHVPVWVPVTGRQ